MSGKVWLVGAGPGDPKLITLMGMECLHQADAVVYDRLVNPLLLAQAPADCVLIDVGKRADHHPIPQEQINSILIEQARLGRNVVRLKGGDPFVFGRGGEEAEALVRAGITCEVVPGITSAIGGLARAGIPVTHRDFASSFHVITGHLREGKDPHNWQLLAQLDGTLVILMGMSRLAEICQTLIAHGRRADTPAAVVMNASHPEQRMVLAPLGELSEQATLAGLSAPSLIVIGEVTSLALLQSL
ncbi:uroporphyrinogen-III C-methyltransferase [Acerihabitans sp. TG2]|uniref:uroporphyrinogen-III C-methyltransferase n=1 Tax=Acerihabitans sp. TG2 TaxID=3096008 RepID=UPI002B22BE32|nr:uroporphyrinogen-III C-methyltransferase [Acerihabitans sp. TG2]MEA9389346.1 uroporphyrinogen-III C-methyltransferase [Acerihabitans sp. TG2]